MLVAGGSITGDRKSLASLEFYGIQTSQLKSKKNKYWPFEDIIDFEVTSNSPWINGIIIVILIMILMSNLFFFLSFFLSFFKVEKVHQV